jgi:hypothetical protein
VFDWVTSLVAVAVWSPPPATATFPLPLTSPPLASWVRCTSPELNVTLVNGVSLSFGSYTLVE